MSTDITDFIHWFRSTAPYIHAHRGKTFVVHFGGELVESPNLPGLIHDIALLNSLGIRLIIVFGARPQIDRLMEEHNQKVRYVNNLRLTDEAALSSVKQAIGSVRIQIEAMLSMGLPNSPMADARIKVTSGNFVTAKPVGILDGVDLEFTGRVRRVDTLLINQKLDNQEIVLIPPLGYSPTGEVFNLSSPEVATQIAINLNADKLVFLSPEIKFREETGDEIQLLTRNEAAAMLHARKFSDNAAELLLSQGLEACERGVNRIHFIDQSVDGNLMLELFSRDGVGTMLSATPFDSIRPARIDDVGGILELIRPLEEDGVLVRRSREKMEMEIDDYLVLVRDGTVIACAALHIYPEESAAELACLVVHNDYQKSARGTELFLKAEKTALSRKVKKLFVLTTQATHWFLEQGFVMAKADDLPVTRKQLYNYQRNSKVLIKNL